MPCRNLTGRLRLLHGLVELSGLYLFPCGIDGRLTFVGKLVNLLIVGRFDTLKGLGYRFCHLVAYFLRLVHNLLAGPLTAVRRHQQACCYSQGSSRQETANDFGCGIRSFLVIGFETS